MNYTQRFNHDINDFEEAKYYFCNRSKQLMFNSIKLNPDKFEDLGWGCHAVFYNLEDKNKEYHSVYVYNSFRNQKKLRIFCEQNPDYTFVTSPDCNIENWFIRNNIKYIVSAIHTDTLYYHTISKFYGDTCAKRSKVPYMNHIDEGLFILKQINASDDAIAAYCLHPMVQRDEDLQKNYFDKNSLLFANDKKDLILAMEYRSVANEYLAHKTDISCFSQIRLSPLKEVNDMLIADKIQNYKDFIQYHYYTHPNWKQLENYFQNWFRALNVSDKMFGDLAELIR